MAAAMPQGTGAPDPPQCAPANDGELWYDAFYQQYFICDGSTGRWLLYQGGCPAGVTLPRGMTAASTEAAIPAC
ncbi:MAG: hypothetical protein ACRDNZ_24325 [Streptosporangiaceae bacterium]